MSNSTSRSIRVAIYLVALVSLAALAWHYPFLFELPLIAAIGGAYWTFFAKTDA